MIQTSGDKRTRDFSYWLRTGRLPQATGPDGLELKYNPWHDPDDGRFTFAQSGRFFGEGASGAAAGAGQAGRQSSQSGGGAARVEYREDPNKPPIRTMAEADAWRAKQLARYGDRSAYRSAIEARYELLKSALNARPSAVTDFGIGAGEGLVEVGKQTGKAIYSALTTNPLTTARETIDSVAGMIDTAIAAEDTPARVQIARAADSVANATAREIGNNVGLVAGNVAIGVMPGAGAAKVAALRRLRTARPRPIPFDPPQVHWVKENLGKESPSTLYNDAATGARQGQAPALKRTMPNGSQRPVKFDGVDGDFVIDRKYGISLKPRSAAQALRQSAVLAQHRLIETWEVPNDKQRLLALKLLKKKNIRNIKVRIVKP
ncbi:hypothetical protein [uncultured Sphingomonas sp.]|uniref:hypothetical protein n=1 Tax=uncultured Sphingomonas sp. TaxID=158754 RepID=UPI0035C97505